MRGIMQFISLLVIAACYVSICSAQVNRLQSELNNNTSTGSSGDNRTGGNTTVTSTLEANGVNQTDLTTTPSQAPKRRSDEGGQPFLCSVIFNYWCKCLECKALSDRAKDEFVTLKWFKSYENDKKPNPYIRAGEKSCEEFRWAYQCFQHCTDDLEPGVQYSLPEDFKNLELTISKYCEPSWDGQAGCRMADTAICDFKHNKKLCGDHLKNYAKCVKDTLDDGDQDCSGVCTPARRYHKVSLFEWEAECKLRQAISGRCRDYAQLYCFAYMKDTEVNWGYFELMNMDPDYQHLDIFCSDAQLVNECLKSTLTDQLEFFGIELDKPCISIEQEIYEIMDKWSAIVRPLCENRSNSTKLVQDLCGERPTTERIPSTTTTQPAPTTPLKTKRVKVFRRIRKNNSNTMKLSMHLASYLSVLLILTQLL